MDWAEKHLESRIHFYYDLQKTTMSRAVASHIRLLLTEARYIQQRREYLEYDMCDDDDLNATQPSKCKPPGVSSNS